MHFVDTEKCKTSKITDYLKKQEDNYKERLTKNKADNKKTTPYGWANKKVQEPLSKCFKQNCGYCGTRVLYNANENQGDIDHFNPKSKVQSDIFKWSNYVWSCKVCNQSKKKDYYDKYLMILDPTTKEDCNCLGFNEGNYYVKTKISNYNEYKKRFDITEDKTLINSETNINDRQDLYQNLQYRIKELLEEKEDFNGNYPNNFVEKKDNLIEFIERQGFELLINEVFIPKLKKKYPEFDKL